MATLFVHLFADVEEEIMSKGLRGSNNDFTIEVLLFKYLMNIRAVAMHFLGKPFDGSTLFVENCFDDMSYMNLRHTCVYKYRELLFGTEVLAHLLSQQESPRYIHAGDPLSW